MTQGANGRSTGLRRAGDVASGQEPGERRGLSADDALPPVEPPSAGFIIKLFVVPALIVAVVVGVVLGFQWLAQSEVDVKSHLSAIEHNANNAWQCANDLAYMLQKDEKLRRDEATAARLSRIVSARVKSGPPQGEDEKQVQQEVAVRVFLCKALGEFATAAAAPGLLEAARPIAAQGSPSPQPADAALTKTIRDGEVEVRKNALEGLALLAHNVRQHGESLATPEVLTLLLEASREVGPDQARAIRERAAYTLGVLGGEQALARLAEMLTDVQSTVRFNAATGLARHGDARGMDVLREMIDPHESVAAEVELGPDESEARVSEEARARLRANLEAKIRLSGISAVEQLCRSNAGADMTKIAAAIQTLIDDPATHPGVTSKAVEVQNAIRERR